MSDFHVPVALTASDYRYEARHALTNQWGVAVWVTLVYSILVSGGFWVFRVFSSSFRDLPRGTVEQITQSPLYSTAIYVGGALIAVAFIIGGPLKVGYARFCLNIADGKPAEFRDLFSGFDVFGQAFLLQLRIFLRVLGWMLLFIIPGYIALFRYSQAYYILAENPELDSGTCIEKSSYIMDGNKGDLFFLSLSFIGWAILSAFTCGIGSLWLNPYINVSLAFFYRNIGGATVRH